MPSFPLPKTYIISQYFFPSTGATAQLATDLADYLSRTAVSLEVVTSSPSRIKNDKPFPITRLSLPISSRSSLLDKLTSGLGFTVLTLIYLLFKAKKTDQILIYSNPPFLVFIVALISFFKGTPYIFVFQDLFPQTASISGIVPARGPIYCLLNYLMRASLKSSKYTVALNHNMANRIKRDFGNNNNLIVIPNWAVQHSETVSRSQNKLAIRWNIDSQFIVQYSGNFGRLHDITTLLEAARLLQGTNILFLFIGHGQKIQYIQYYKDRYSLKNVEIYPYQPRHLLHLSLSLADVSVISQLNPASDCLAPSKLYGILASGKPIIYLGSTDSDIYELITSHKCGVAHTPGDVTELAKTLLELSHDPGLCKSMGACSFKLSNSHYRPEISLKLYKSLLDT